MKLILHTDGGARGNPGPAGIGVVIADDKGKVIKLIKEYVGEGTNNQAEYKALLKGLKEASAMNAEEVICNMDSELVVKQLTGLYKIKEPGLQVLASEVLSLTGKFKQIKFHHVRREKNVEADKLVNEVLDENASRKA
ncbi:MAG: ribonuclease HI family protein [Candidatus Doudnabacteria bacterium]|nr:ribonuclease HI family protein [Candidatus Doudnabacteria bacterium]